MLARIGLVFLLTWTHCMATERYLALGDSYTIGEGVAEDARWPVQLARRMQWDAPTVIARTGWTTDELASALDAAALDPPYAHVSLLIGVNNQYRGRSVGNYVSEFRALLDRAITLAGGDVTRVFVLSIPDWGVTRFAARDGRGPGRIAREIDTYNDAARAICAARGVRAIDITMASRERGDDADMFAADGLHPSVTQYAHWVDVTIAALSGTTHR